MEYYMISMMVVVLVISFALLIAKLSRKTEHHPTTKYKDFISIAALCFAGYVLFRLVIGNDITHIESTDSLTKALQITIPALLVFFLLVYTVVTITKGSNITNDERTEFSHVKSSRNTLLAISFALFVFLGGGSQILARNSIIIILSIGYFVYLGSQIFYYYL